MLGTSYTSVLEGGEERACSAPRIYSCVGEHATILALGTPRAVSWTWARHVEVIRRKLGCYLRSSDLRGAVWNNDGGHLLMLRMLGRHGVERPTDNRMTEACCSDTSAG